MTSPFNPKQLTKKPLHMQQRAKVQGRLRAQSMLAIVVITISLPQGVVLLDTTLWARQNSADYNESRTNKTFHHQLDHHWVYFALAEAKDLEVFLKEMLTVKYSLLFIKEIGNYVGGD